MQLLAAKQRSIEIRAVILASLTAVALLTQVAPAHAQMPKVKVGRTIGGSGFHIPSYIAIDKGLFKAEGLDADFIAAQAGVLVRAGIAKEIEFVPIPGGGSEAMLKGAPLTFIVGESLISQWTITTTPDIKRVEDLKGKTIGLERPGQAAYTEAVVVLGKFFKMEPGKDYKVITFTAEPDRVAALINKSIQGAILSFPHAARAEKEGMKVLLKTGDYIPRLGGTFMTHRDLIKEKRDVVKRFIRAMVKADDYVKENKKGTIEVIQKYFEVKDPVLAEGIYKQVANAFGPDIPHDLLLELFQSRTTPELGWPAGKPLPDIEQFVARDLLNETLKEMGRTSKK
ncbi:MAG TPA: ABC transporter substrate-binding protein [Candidatus Acidoferrales bacterium]|nr:ABC transporter substrate-binding protein [Candidatus Acidoferrales bacterium]